MILNDHSATTSACSASFSLIEDSPQQPRREIRTLNGIRGLCAVCVVFGHYDLASYSPLFRLFSWHNAAVDIFFCLSGYTMFYVHGREAGPLSFIEFIWKRIARIWPLAVATLLLSVPIYLHHMRSLGHYLPATRVFKDIVLQILLVNCWILLGNGVQYNPPQWSISIEWLLYLVLFPTLYVFSKYFTRLPSLLALASAIGIMTCSVITYNRYFDPTNTGLGLSAGVLMSMLLRGLFGFTAGFLIYIVSLDSERLFRIGAYSGLVSLLAAMVILLSASGCIAAQWLVVLAPLIILTNLQSTTWASRLFASKALNWLGLISFSIYLLHNPLLWYTMLFTRHALRAFVAYNMLEAINKFVALLILFPIGATSYKLIEQPARRMLNAAARRL